MNFIKVINDLDFDLELHELHNPKMRIGARGLVFNDKNEIAILNKQNKNEFKLVGGGVEEGEDPKLAFEREIMEETGCEIEVDKFLGNIKEEQTKGNFVQISYVYVAHVINNTNKLDLTEKEKDEGAKLLWLKIDDAMNLIKNCEDKLKASKYDSVYNTKFIVRRDYEILKFYKKVS